MEPVGSAPYFPMCEQVHTDSVYNVLSYFKNSSAVSCFLVWPKGRKGICTVELMNFATAFSQQEIL